MCNNLKSCQPELRDWLPGRQPEIERPVESMVLNTGWHSFCLDIGPRSSYRLCLNSLGIETTQKERRPKCKEQPNGVLRQIMKLIGVRTRPQVNQMLRRLDGV